MNNNKISILLCCYNYEKFVAEAIQSVLDQTYDNFELLIADDCSTDSSAEVIKKFNDPRITFIQNESNLGFMGTRNKLLKMVNCDYVAFQDADDVWLPTKLEKQMEHMLAHPECAACFTSADLIDENSKKCTDQSKCDIDINTFCKSAQTRYEIIKQFFCEGNFISHPSALLRTKTLKDIGQFDEKLIQLQDYDYWCRIAAKYNIYILNEILMHVRRVSKKHVGLSGLAGAQVRTIYESLNIIKNLIESLDITTFTKSFNNYLLRTPNNSLELLSEKYFLLLKWNIMDINNKMPALTFFSEHFNNEWEDILKKKYNYTLKDFFKETGQPIQLYPTSLYKDYIELEEHVNRLQQIIDSQTNHINNLNKTINDIHNSTSWKLTKPIRAIKHKSPRK